MDSDQVRITADTLILSKENIQPLKQGRKTAQLGVALLAQDNSELQQQLIKEREKYELLIRMYEGPDPLQPRYDYVSWLEQSCIKHGRESNLTPLLEDTISVFKDDARYKQDPRFIELIVKYIETQSNPLELFQVVYGQGIGTQCSLLYKAWAEELDKNQDPKRADQVYMLGISNRAEPLEVLEQAHLLFQLSVGRRMLNGGLTPEAKPEESNLRQVLGKLKKTQVNTVRLPHGLPGTLPVSSSMKTSSRSNTMVTVFQEEENNEPEIGTKSQKLDKFPKAETTHKENTLKAGTWNRSYKLPNLTPVQVSTPFKVHMDPVEPGSSDHPRQISATPHALKTRRAEGFSCPMAIFEPPDPSVKPMYCKQKIYAGGREFQLEEIRAAIYNKRYEQKMQEEEMKKLGLDSHLTLNENCRKMSTSAEASDVKPMILTPICESVKRSVTSLPTLHEMWESPKGNEDQERAPLFDENASIPKPRQLQFRHENNESISHHLPGVHNPLPLITDELDFSKEDANHSSETKKEPFKFNIYCETKKEEQSGPDSYNCKDSESLTVFSKDHKNYLAKTNEMKIVAPGTSQLKFPIFTDSDSVPESTSSFNKSKKINFTVYSDNDVQCSDSTNVRTKTNNYKLSEDIENNSNAPNLIMPSETASSIPSDAVRLDVGGPKESQINQTAPNITTPLYRKKSMYPDPLKPPSLSSRPAALKKKTFSVYQDN